MTARGWTWGRSSACVPATGCGAVVGDIAATAICSAALASWGSIGTRVWFHRCRYDAVTPGPDAVRVLCGRELSCVFV